MNRGVSFFSEKNRAEDLFTVLWTLMDNLLLPMNMMKIGIFLYFMFLFVHYSVLHCVVLCSTARFILFCFVLCSVLFRICFFGDNSRHILHSSTNGIKYYLTLHFLQNSFSVPLTCLISVIKRVVLM